MKKFFKRVFSLILVLLIASSIFATNNSNILGAFDITAAAASSYNPDAAISYAAANWNNGVGLCAEFVSNCLTAGGVNIMQKKVVNLRNTLVNGGYGTSYKLTSSSTQWGQVAKMSDNAGKVKVGDPLFTYCSACGYTHAVICGGVDSSGYITIYAHNSAKNNQKYYADCTKHSASYVSIYSVSMNTHTHSYVHTSTTYTSCTNDGYYHYSCSCGGSYSTKYQNAYGHSYTKFSYSESAHPHYKIYSCSNGCGATQRSGETSYIDSCDTCNHKHSYSVSSTRAATCTQDGIKYYSCRCGSSYSEKYQNALGHSYTAFSHNESAHPHYKVYSCSRGCGATQRSNETSFNASCMQCSPPKYSLSYDANGGTDAPSTQNGAASYTINDAVPIKEGYKFLGWSETASATEASYQPGDTINISKNTTLYAVWQVSFVCSDCGEEFSDEGLYNEHTASCEGGTVTLFGLFMSFLISIFGYIIMLPLLPFMIFA